MATFVFIFNTGLGFRATERIAYVHACSWSEAKSLLNTNVVFQNLPEGYELFDSYRMR